MNHPTVMTIFRSVPDPRVERTRRHKLVDILLLGLIGTIWGCKGWDAIVLAARIALEPLQTLLELPNGIPSADTLRRVFAAVDPLALGKAFTQWAQALCESTAGKLVAIDGKTVRGSFEGKSGKGALHLVNAWVSENQMVLGQYATDVKSNEITAIPELLELLSVRGATISMDAMGCQKAIAQQIVDKGADYLFGLKGNHPTLHQEVLGAFDPDTCAALRGDPNSFHETCDKGHGRLEVRRAWVLRDVEWLTRSEQWPKLTSLVLVESERTIDESTSCERRTYISSLEAPAAMIASRIREHWQIENNLHWVLDVTFDEDRARISRKNGAENLALIRKLALSLLKNAPNPHRAESVAGRRLATTLSFPYLRQVLSAGIQAK